MLHKILENIKLLTSSQRITLWLNYEDRNLVPLIMTGINYNEMLKISIDLTGHNGGLAPQCATKNEWYLINNNDSTIRPNIKFEQRLNYQVQRTLVYPIGSEEKNLGVIQLLNADRNYTYEDVKVVSYYAEIISCALLGLDYEAEIKKYNLTTNQQFFDKNEIENFTHIEMIDNFVISNKQLISFLWNSVKTLFVLETMEDTRESREFYFISLFSERLITIKEGMQNFSLELQSLRQNSDNNQNIRDFCHQISPSLGNANTYLVSAQKALQREMDGKNETTNATIISKLSSVLNDLNAFYRLIKQYMLLDNTLKEDNVTAGDIQELLDSYTDWLSNYCTPDGTTVDYEYIGNVHNKINANHFTLDCIRIKEILDTLVTNAAEELAQCAQDNKHIAVDVFIDVNQLKIIVSDNGRGVDENIKEKIFQKYFTYGKAGGTGLGLGLVKVLIDTMRGTITQYNDNGAVFSVSIPIKTRG